MIQTTAAEALDDSETGVDVHDSLGFATSAETDDVVLIDAEFLHVTAGMGTTTWTVTRAYAGSTAATHADGATITRIGRSWTDLSRFRARTGNTDSVTIMAPIIDAANGAMTREVGIFLGPSTDTVRTYDGIDATRYGRRLWIPGGIRTLTAIRVAYWGGALGAATLGDFVLGPRPFTVRPEMPYSYVDFIDVSTSFQYFPKGHSNIELTGTFGYAETPSELQEMADALLIRMWKARVTGWGGTVGSEAFGTASVVPFLTGPERAKLAAYRMEYAGLVR